MHIALQGALIGVAVALFLLLADYLMLRKAVHERAALQHRKPEFEDAERRRLASLARLCIFVPAAFALFFWLVWG